MSLFKDKRGDTIIEVMIATAVLSMVLASSYYITNRSLANSRQAQEHGEALKIAQSQLEQLRQIASETSDGDGVFRPGYSYCFADRDIGSPATIKAGDLVYFTAASTLPDGADADYPAACRDIGSVAYRTGIKYSGGSSPVFTAYVTWDGVTGGQDKISAVYGAYPR